MKLKVNIITALAEHIINALSLFITYRLVIKILGVETLGLWSLLLSLFSLTSIGNAGFASSTLKFVAKYKAYEDNTKIVRVIETSLITVIITTILMLLLSALIIVVFQKKIFSEEEKVLIMPVLLWVVIGLFVAIIGRVYLSSLDGLNLIHYRSYIGIISKIVFLILSIYGVNRIGLEGLALANLAHYVVMLLLAVFLLKKQFSQMRLLCFRFDKALFREIFNYGYQFQISSIFQMLIDPVAKFFLKDFGGLASVGIFEVVYKFFLQARMFVVVVLSVLVPTVASLKEVSPSQIIKLFKTTLYTTCIISVFLFALTFALMPLLLSMVSVVLDFNILMYAIYIYLGLLANLLGATPYLFNLGIGELKDNTITSGIMAITCCLFAFILGNIWQGHGVVIGWALSQILANVLLLLFFMKKEGLDYKSILRKTSQIVLTLNFLFVISFFYTMNVFLFDPYMSLIVGLLLFIVYLLANYWLLPQVRILYHQFFDRAAARTMGYFSKSTDL